eukprot:g12591.t1
MGQVRVSESLCVFFSPKGGHAKARRTISSCLLIIMTLCALRTAGLLWLLALLAPPLQAVRFGDRHYGMEQEGYFIACSKNGFHFINPVDQTIMKSIPNPTGSRCGDGVYLRTLAHTGHYYGQAMYDADEIWLINTDTMELEAKVRAGGNPLHIYAIQRRDEFWTHSDDTATFDVIDADEIGYLHHADYEVKVKQSGHGKLLFDPHLVDVAYSTNVNEGGIFEIHLEDHYDAVFYNFSERGAPAGKVCTGTHGIAFSDINRNLYVECAGSQGWEIDTPDGSGLWEFSLDSKQVVKVWDGFLGQVYCPLEEDYIVTVNKLKDIVHILHPEEDRTDDSFVDFIVPGHPDQTQWIPKDDTIKYGTGRFHDYELWFSQTADDTAVGVAWIDLQRVVDWKEGEPVPQATTIPVGKIKGYSKYNTYRSIARGGNWVATEVHEPTMGVAIIDMRKHELVSIVPGIVEPGHVRWIPKHSDEVGYRLEKEVNRLQSLILSGQRSSSKSISAGGAAGAVDALPLISLLVSTAALLSVLWIACGNRSLSYDRVVNSPIG